MENQSHPEPTGEKRDNAGDQAGNNGCTQGVHKFSSVTRTRSCEQDFAPTAIGQSREKSRDSSVRAGPADWPEMTIVGGLL
jgi:hypothetical protein